MAYITRMLKFIPVSIQAGIHGFTSPARDYIQEPLSLDELLIDHPSATFFGYASGDSMVGEGIFDGDLMVVDRSLEVKDGDVIVATLNGVFVCKKVDKINKRLVSSAPDFQPYYLTEGDEFIVEGVVIRTIRLHRKLRDGAHVRTD